MDFFGTRMGRQLIDSTLPRLATALERIAKQFGEEPVWYEYATTRVEANKAHGELEPPDSDMNWELVQFNYNPAALSVVLWRARCEGNV